MTFLLGRLARAATARWKRSLAIVAAVLVALGALGQAVGGSFSDDFSTPGTGSQRAIDLLEDRFPQQSGDTATVVFFADDGTLRDGSRPAAIARAVREIEAQPHVTAAPAPRLSRDGRIGFSEIQYDERSGKLGTAPDKRLETALAPTERAGIGVARRGQVVDQARQPTAPVGELIGVAVAIVVLVLALGSVSAMLVTLISAGIALAGGLMLLTIGSAATDFPSFAPTLGVMLGLGAGIDYALLIVGRYREQRAAGDDVAEAAGRANATAGTSVLAAGAIVVVAISGLLATGIPFVGQMGIGSAIVVACVAVGAVTVLPVMLGAARRFRVGRAAPVEPSRFFSRWDAAVTRRPRRAALAGTLILLALASPVTVLRLGQPDDGNDANGTTTRVAYDKLADGFGPGFNGPLVLAAAVPRDGQAALARVRRAVARTPGVAAVGPPRISPAGDAATMTVTPATSPQDERTSELVRRLREDVLPAGVHVGGATATFEDMADRIAARLPIFIALVVGLSVVLLMAVFRSVLVPLVSAAFNLLSILAAYGIVVAVFQRGWGSSLLGVDGEVPIVSFIPLFMFAILFGLSMDYNVFLLSRVREEYLRGASPRDSVVIGLSRVAKIIFAAGAIMASVFLGFASDPDVIVKMIGVGLASAILVDVLVVRLMLAPAVMVLLGHRAWWLPGWLNRALPRISLDGERPAEAAS